MKPSFVVWRQRVDAAALRENLAGLLLADLSIWRAAYSAGFGPDAAITYALACVEVGADCAAAVEAVNSVKDAPGPPVPF